jgi:hypothetical protein
MQELALKRGVKVADLVQENGALVRRLELADLQLVGAREGTPFVAEELARAARARPPRS